MRLIAFGVTFISFVFGTLCLRYVIVVAETLTRQHLLGRPLPLFTQVAYSWSWLLLWAWIVPALLLTLVIRSKSSSETTWASIGIMLAICGVLWAFGAAAMLMPLYMPVQALPP